MRTVAMNRVRGGWRHAAVVRKYQAAVPGPQAPVEVGPEHVALVAASASWTRSSARSWCCTTWPTSAPADIAVELGIPEGTVKSRLARARARLAALLGEEEGERHV